MACVLQAPDIGDLQAIQVVCNGSGLGAAWHLDHIVVTNLATLVSARFEYKDWFDAKKGWTHTLYSGQGAQVGGPPCTGRWYTRRLMVLQEAGIALPAQPAASCWH